MSVAIARLTLPLSAVITVLRLRLRMSKHVPFERTFFLKSAYCSDDSRTIFHQIDSSPFKTGLYREMFNTLITGIKFFPSMCFQLPDQNFVFKEALIAVITAKKLLPGASQQMTVEAALL